MRPRPRPWAILLACAAPVLILAWAVCGAHGSSFATIKVLTNFFDPTLHHNFPNLQVTAGEATRTAEFWDHFLATGRMRRLIAG